MTCEHLGHFKEIHLSLDAFPNMCSLHLPIVVMNLRPLWKTLINPGNLSGTPQRHPKKEGLVNSFSEHYDPFVKPYILRGIALEGTLRFP